MSKYQVKMYIRENIYFRSWNFSFNVSPFKKKKKNFTIYIYLNFK